MSKDSGSKCVGGMTWFYEKLVITKQNNWKLTIVKQSDKKVILKYVKTQKLLASTLYRRLKNWHFLTVKWIRGEGVQISTTNVANHTSAINSSVPPKFNHHYKQQWLASQLVPYETFRHMWKVNYKFL